MAAPYSPAYLIWSLFLLAVATGFWLLCPVRRRLMLSSALLSAPCALYSPLFVPDYWQPSRMVVFITGVEDIIFSFANGVIVFGLTFWVMQDRRLVSGSPSPRPSRFLLPCLAAVPTVLVLKALGMPIMSATLAIGAVVWSLCLLNCRGKTFPLSIAGAATFGFFTLPS